MSPQRAYHWRLPAMLAAPLLVVTAASAFGLERFPPPEFTSGHQLPANTFPVLRPGWMQSLDLCVLMAALSAAAWLVLWKRSRRGIFLLSVFSLIYFGFYRGGCICPIGAIQNVTLAAAQAAYALPLTVAMFFALPLVFSLFFGRVFCGGVCPLGAMQDVALVKPLTIPSWLERPLSVIPFLYLGGAVLYAVTNTMFPICRYDPFVALFRLSGSFSMLIAGGVVLVLSVFVGRPYCRFMCPYGALLGVFSRFAWKRTSITPDKCIACNLCETSCPFAAIRAPTPEGASEES